MDIEFEEYWNSKTWSEHKNCLEYKKWAEYGWNCGLNKNEPQYDYDYNTKTIIVKDAFLFALNGGDY